MEPTLNGSDGPPFVETGSTPRHSRGQQLVSSSEVNITNCHRQLTQIYRWQRLSSEVNVNDLIAYWMMGGYLGPIHSVEEAYLKGRDVVSDLIYKEGSLKFTDSRKGVTEIVHPFTYPALCKHQGSCFGNGIPEFVSFKKSGRYGNIMLTDGVLKRRWELAHYNEESDRKYLAHFNPTTDSLKTLLENHTNLHILVLRGCQIVPQSTFPLELLTSLKALEISGSSYLTTIPENTISQLIHLHYLHLFDLLITNLPDEFFSKLSSLKRVIIRCSELHSLPSINNCFQLNHLDLSHCTALQEMVSTGTGSLENLGYLDLSYTALTYMPPFLVKKSKPHSLFLRGSKLRDLNPLQFEKIFFWVLDLSGAKELNYTNYKIYGNPEAVDLSRTQITCLEIPVNRKKEQVRIRTLILQDCTSLKKITNIGNLRSLQQIDLSGCVKLLELNIDMGSDRYLWSLNLSGCSGLQILREDFFYSMSSLSILDLSGTKVKHLPSFAQLTNLCTLSLRDMELDSLEPLKSLANLVDLELKGLKLTCSQELNLDFLESLEKLQILNLSKTSVTKLPNMSKLASLKELILADCQSLNAVPDLQTLPNLEVLDLSLPDGPALNCQAKIEFESQGGRVTLSAPSSLLKLILTNRSGVQKLFPLISLGKLELLDLRGTDVTSLPYHYVEQIKCLHLPIEIYFSAVSSSRMGHSPKASNLDNNVQGEASKTGEIYIVSLSKSKAKSHYSDEASSSISNKDYSYSDISVKLEGLIDEMQKSFITNAMANGINSHGEITIQNRTFKLHRLHSDLKFIQSNLDRLESSQNCKPAIGLLQKLIAATTHLSIADFLKDATILMKLVGIVVKLKLLFPRPEAKPEEAPKITKKKEEKPWWERSMDKENGVVIPTELSNSEWQDLRISYETLAIVEKECLLCISVFPCNEDKDENARVSRSIVIKKRMLIYWWVGEGFIGPHSKKNYPHEDGYLIEGSKPMTIEEMGERVLGVLTEKGFIQPVMERGRERTHCGIRQIVQCFVIDKAKEVGFFDFNQNSSKLSTHFTRSKRACLLKAEPKFTSSCKLWESYISSPKKLESFRYVRTLFNVNDSVVEIKPEWFSEMKSLLVLHLGSWRCDNSELIEVEDYKFLEKLKCMKQLRLLSLQGLPTLKKLPNSVCKLTNLIILDLRECSYLEELPADIGYLKSVTHLDITNCRLLYMLPKGIRLLSKLEVLKGFMTTNLDSGKHACTLADLLNLKRLRKLSMIVNSSMSPSDEELQVLREMGNLRKLRISWETGNSSAETLSNVEELRLSKWNKLKCWGHQSDQHVKQEASNSKCLDSLEKLELRCFPGETAPKWLNPNELKKLQKLYILGAKQVSSRLFDGGNNKNKWNVTTVRFRYLPEMDITWRNLMLVFPNLAYFEHHECPKLIFFPCDQNNVWRLSRN